MTVQSIAPVGEAESTEEPTAAPPPIVDGSVVDGLIEVGGGDPSFLAELFQLFNDGAIEGLGNLRKALVDLDLFAVRQAAHKLRGSARAVGVLAVAELCEKLEDLAAQGTLSQIVGCQTLKELDLQVALARRELQRIASGPGPMEATTRR